MSDKLAIPVEVLDLVRFMCSTWNEIDKWAWENMTAHAMGSYPTIQGTARQVALMSIGETQFNAKNLDAAVKWMMSNTV